MPLYNWLTREVSACLTEGAREHRQHTTCHGDGTRSTATKMRGNGPASCLPLSHTTDSKGVTLTIPDSKKVSLTIPDSKKVSLNSWQQKIFSQFLTAKIFLTIPDSKKFFSQFLTAKIFLTIPDSKIFSHNSWQQNFFSQFLTAACQSFFLSKNFLFEVHYKRRKWEETFKSHFYCVVRGSREARHYQERQGTIKRGKALSREARHYQERQGTIKRGKALSREARHYQERQGNIKRGKAISREARQYRERQGNIKRGKAIFIISRGDRRCHG